MRKAIKTVVYYDDDTASILRFAEGKSALNSAVEREGLVFKCLERRESFKAISNRYLEKQTD